MPSLRYECLIGFVLYFLAMLVVPGAIALIALPFSMLGSAAIYVLALPWLLGGGLIAGGVFSSGWYLTRHTKRLGFDARGFLISAAACVVPLIVLLWWSFSNPHENASERTRHVGDFVYLLFWVIPLSSLPFLYFRRVVRRAERLRAHDARRRDFLGDDA